MLVVLHLVLHQLVVEVQTVAVILHRHLESELQLEQKHRSLHQHLQVRLLVEQPRSRT
jgi:hypothetical protein